MVKKKKVLATRIPLMLIATIIACLAFSAWLVQAPNALSKNQKGLAATGGASAGSLSLVILKPPLCNFTVEPEWNLISFCANPAYKSISSAFATLHGSYDYVLHWNETAQAYDIYSMHAENNSFNEIKVNESYFVYVNSSTPLTFYVGGSQNDQDMNISLANKWNAPAYPYNTTGNVSKYLESIAGKYLYVLKWSADDQSYSVWSSRAATKPFSQILKGEGQFIYISASQATLKYNRSYITG